MGEQLSLKNRRLIDAALGCGKLFKDREMHLNSEEIEILLNAARSEGPHPEQIADAGKVVPHPESGEWVMTFDEVEDLHSRISSVITAQERGVPDEQDRWDRLMETRTSLAQWLEAKRPDLTYAGGSWPKSAPPPPTEGVGNLKAATDEDLAGWVAFVPKGEPKPKAERRAWLITNQYEDENGHTCNDEFGIVVSETEELAIQLATGAGFDCTKYGPYFLDYERPVVAISSSKGEALPVVSEEARDMLNARNLLNRWLKASNGFFDGTKLRMTAHPVHDDTVEFLAALSLPRPASDKGEEAGVWARIGADDRLKRARQRLSLHELRMIVDHARARPHQQEDKANG